MERARPADGGPDAARWLLGIDTSTERAGIAVTDGQTSASLAWNARRSQTTSLFGVIENLLQLAQLSMSDIAAVGVAVGPGTFNGLRVGMAAAKGLVLGQQMPLIGVGTLDATAYPFLLNRQPVLAVEAAGRGRLVTATYTPNDGADLTDQGTDPLAGWHVEGPTNERVADVARRLQDLPEHSWLVGELTEAQIAELGDVLGARRIVVPAGPLRERTPVALASLAWERWQRGCTDDSVELSPVYLHGQASTAASGS